uniref:Chaperone protein DnaK n=1 Tax=Lygus hesperus TaxID=30085 RepID=A0A0A9XVQ6_LYGHE
MSNILNNILKSARDSSGSLLNAVGLKGSKSGNLRPLQGQTDPKFCEEDNNGVPGVRPSWTPFTIKDNNDDSLLDQTEKIISYYRNRLIFKQTQKKTDADPNASNEYEDDEIDQIQPESVNIKEGKSLYSLMARRKGNSRSYPIGRHSKKTRAEQSILSPLPDPYNHQNTYCLPESTTREFCFNKLRRSVSSPILWGSGKWPLGCSPILLDENASRLLTEPHGRKMKSKRRNSNRQPEKSPLYAAPTNQDDEVCEFDTSQQDDKQLQRHTMPTIKSQQGLAWKISSASLKIPSSNSQNNDQILLTK